jgi:hypothetical protein
MQFKQDCQGISQVETVAGTEESVFDYRRRYKPPTSTKEVTFYLSRLAHHSLTMMTYLDANSVVRSFVEDEGNDRDEEHHRTQLRPS